MVGVSVVHTVPGTASVLTNWPVAATGPFGLIPFTLQGGQPTVVALPLPVGFTAFAATPGTPLNDIKAPAAGGGDCVLSEDNPVCSTADLGQGAIGTVLFGQRACTSEDVGCLTGTEVELAGDFGELYGTGLGGEPAPARVVLTCLASECPHLNGLGEEEGEAAAEYNYNYDCTSYSCAGNGSLFGEREVEEDFVNYPVYVKLKGSEVFEQAGRCVEQSDLSTTGVINLTITEGKRFCVDVNAIDRDGNSFMAS